MVGAEDNRLVRAADGVARLARSIAGTINYGWLRFDAAMGGPWTITITEFAIQDSPDTAIRVGDTGQSGTIPVPGTLSLLVLAGGAGALTRVRRRRQVQQAAAA